nr:MAG TPA: hypothetical protein [Bacteriophage sp.]
MRILILSWWNHCNRPVFSDFNICFTPNLFIIILCIYNLSSVVIRNNLCIAFFFFYLMFCKIVVGRL